MTERLIDRALVETRVRDLAKIGKVGETGVTRTVYSPEWLAAQDLLESWMRQARLETRRDAVRNLWGVAHGNETGPSIVSGSHVDSQAPGGRFDGALGVIAALTAVEGLLARYGRPK
jgi:allantoate deiminase